MTYRFEKKVFNDEKGVRSLAFFKPGDFAQKFITFDLNLLEDQRADMGDFAFAVMFTRLLQEATGFLLNPAEIEYAVEDI